MKPISCCLDETDFLLSRCRAPPDGKSIATAAALRPLALASQQQRDESGNLNARTRGKRYGVSLAIAVLAI
jgi:hypothetical protein